MDDMWDYSTYDTGYWSSNYAEKFSFNFEHSEVLTNCEQAITSADEFYSFEDDEKEYNKVSQGYTIPFINNELTKKNGLENETSSVTNSSINNNSNNKINLKRKASNDADSLFSKKKIQHHENMCSVCFTNNTKYRFPCCGESYCSVVCFKKHDRIVCLEQMNNSSRNIEKEGAKEFNSIEIYNNSNDERACRENNKFQVLNKENEDTYSEYSDMEEYCLTEDQKKKIKNDMALRVLLKNSYVHSVFREFLLAKDKVMYLSHYISDPTIIRVLDQIMKSIEEKE